ncbi:MAG TPA: hypothetical protein VMF67_00920 [Rhizomicrobium sp.]|nr:hypothetical protein [Rhizomicrobium sp.]
MSKHHGSETLKFEGFSGYYGSVPSGYGGFVWSDVDYLNDSYWQNVKTNWCDTGYQNALDGSGLAFARYDSVGHYGATQYYHPSYGYFRSDNLKDTFNLVSMVAASAWETKQTFQFRSYVYEPDKGFVLKGIATIKIGQTAQTIVFADLQQTSVQRAAFDHISALRIVSAGGSFGNTCSYGAGDYTRGNQLAFDNLKITWNGGVPHGAGRAPAKPLLANHHGAPVAAHLAANMHAAHAAPIESATLDHATDGYHSELQSLPGHGPAGLTAQFDLPSVEHFGT